MTVNVLYFINSLGPGGSERSLLEMVPELAGRGIGVHVVCLFGNGDPRGPLGSDPQLRVTHLPGRNWAERLRAAHQLVVAQNPDVVHTTLFEADLIGRLAAVGLDVPVLTSLVSTPYVPERVSDPNVGAVKLRMIQIVEAVSGWWMTDHFHAVSETVRDAAVRDLRIPRERVTVVPRGRDERRLGRTSPERRRAARRRLGVGAPDTEPFVLLNAGRQEFAKGQMCLIDAVSKLRQMRDVLCIVAGREGHATSELQRAVTAGRLGTTVRFLGHRDDLPELLVAADVFVFPSIYEGLPGAVIEAMALEVPIVASDIPAVREVTGDGRCASLVPPGDGVALAAAIRRLLDDPDRQLRYAATGRELFERRYRLGKVVGQMARLYRRLARRSGMKMEGGS